MSRTIEHPIYIKKISPYIGKPLIKVLTGMRRVGKTYFLKNIIEHLQKNYNITKENILYIDKEDENFSDIVNDKTLSVYIKKKLRT